MKLRSIALLAPALALAGPMLFGQTPAPEKTPPGTPAAKTEAPAPAPVVPESTVVLSVGEMKMTRGQYESLLKAMPDKVRMQAMGPAKRQMAERIVEVDALAQEARKRKIDEKPETREITAFQVNSMLAGFLYQQLLEGSKPDQAAVKAYYDEHAKDYEEAKSRHILIRFKGSQVPLRKDAQDLTPEEALAKAQEVRKRLVGGEDFAKVAKETSDDTGSGAQGGELGFMARTAVVAEFANALFSQKIGDIGEPVKSPFGYHIVQVEERRPQPMEKVQADIEAKLKPVTAEKQADAIKKQLPVSINNDYFGK